MLDVWRNEESVPDESGTDHSVCALLVKDAVVVALDPVDVHLHTAQQSAKSAAKSTTVAVGHDVAIALNLIHIELLSSETTLRHYERSRKNSRLVYDRTLLRYEHSLGLYRTQTTVECSAVDDGIAVPVDLVEVTNGTLNETAAESAADSSKSATIEDSIAVAVDHVEVLSLGARGSDQAGQECGCCE